MSLPVTSHGLTTLGPVHESLARLQGWHAHGVAALLGALAALAFAPFHATPVLLVSFTGLVWMIDGARAHRRWGKAVFARGWAFGFGFFLVSMHWTAMAFLVEPEKHAVFLFMPLIILPGGMGLITGAGAALAGTFWSASPSRVVIFAMAYAFAEWIRGHLFGGFPWNLPGTTWVPGGPVSQLASIGGVYWLTLLTVFAAATPAAVVDTRDVRGLFLRLVPALSAIVMIGSAWVWGAQRLEAATVETDRAVVLMDSGVPQNEKFNDGVPDRIYLRYIELLRMFPADTNDIVIWPEGAIPYRVINEPILLDRISNSVGDRTLILGTARRQPIDGRQLDFNSVAVVDDQGWRSGPLAIYDKHRLVPFGELAAQEIIPFGAALAGVLPDALQRNLPQGFSPGPGADLKVVADIPPFIPMICYEGLFPEIPHQAWPVHDDADWMVIVSNDAWFGAGMGPAQHYAQNRYRAIEMGAPIARVASRGATAMVDAYGRQTARGAKAPGDPEGWRSSVARAPLPAALEDTLFRRRGGAFFWISLMLFSLLAFLFWRR